MPHPSWIKSLINHARSLQDPRYRGLPLLLSRQRRGSNDDGSEGCRSLEPLNLRMAGLDIQPAFESSFNQIARRLAKDTLDQEVRKASS
jgi:hypothetical protein